MARTINQATLLGHLGGDAEFRHLPSGEAVASLRLATSRSYRLDDGDWAEETEWHDIVVWKADRLEKHRDRLQKCDLVQVMGRLRTRSWEDRDGHRRQRTEVACFAGDVILLAPAAAEDSGDGSQPPQGEAGDDGRSASSAFWNSRHECGIRPFPCRGSRSDLSGPFVQLVLRGLRRRAEGAASPGTKQERLQALPEHPLSRRAVSLPDRARPHGRGIAQPGIPVAVAAQWLGCVVGQWVEPLGFFLVQENTVFLVGAGAQLLPWPTQAREHVLRLGAGDSVPVVYDLDGLESVQIVVNQGYVDTRRVCADRVPEQLGEQCENWFPSLRYSHEMIILNLYLKRLGCHAAHLAESTSACCRTVCTAAS
ncbi:MAG: single-stranded DNA-binding protein [Bryobacterales bacterium]|nr:single-stranded DNA-binding protein [Bryobacterales bacterium]